MGLSHTTDRVQDGWNSSEAETLHDPRTLHHSYNMPVGRCSAKAAMQLQYGAGRVQYGPYSPL